MGVFCCSIVLCIVFAPLAAPRCGLGGSVATKLRNCQLTVSQFFGYATVLTDLHYYYYYYTTTTSLLLLLLLLILIVFVVKWTPVD